MHFINSFVNKIYNIPSLFSGPNLLNNVRFVNNHLKNISCRIYSDFLKKLNILLYTGSVPNSILTMKISVHELLKGTVFLVCKFIFIAAAVPKITVHEWITAKNGLHWSKAVCANRFGM